MKFQASGSGRQSQKVTVDNLLTRKLEKFAPLSVDERRLLDDVVKSSRGVAARTDIIHEGQVSRDVRLILQGFACRYKLLKDGKRQIVAYLVPGDFCDLNVFILKAMDHSIGTLSPCRVVDIPRHRILEMMERPGIARAIWYATLVDEATLREWLLNVGQRDAVPRIGHLLCELLARLRVVGLVNDNSYELPLTQSEIGDTTGLTNVHVNRCLQQLRDKGLIEYKTKHITIRDLAGLSEFTGFTPNYLHLENEMKLDRNGK